MRVFVSYARENRDVAEQLAAGLESAGYDIFLDRDDLTAGASFDDRIRSAVSRTHIFVFLASPESLATGGYALTELDLARRRWPRPSGRVLPVLLSGVDVQSLPPYLRSVTVLESRGNLTADVLAALSRLRGERRVGMLRRTAMAVCPALLLVTWGWFGLPVPWASGSDLDLLEIQARMTPPGNSDGDPEFTFTANLRNHGDAAITAFEISPQTDREDITFASSATPTDVNPGETTPVEIWAKLDKNAAAGAFRWRLCAAFVPAWDWYEMQRSIERGREPETLSNYLDPEWRSQHDRSQRDLQAAADEEIEYENLYRRRTEVCSAWTPWSVAE